MLIGKDSLSVKHRNSQEATATQFRNAVKNIRFNIQVKIIFSLKINTRFFYTTIFTILNVKSFTILNVKIKIKCSCFSLRYFYELNSNFDPH